MNFLLGCNYWGADYGTEMWRHYDGEKIRAELKQLYEYGVRSMRVFPNWRDFQPVDRAYSYHGEHGEYVNVNTGEPVYDHGVDMAQIANFRDFCTAAGEIGMTLTVAIVTGWMSGRLFVPPVLQGKNLITDPEALMWMRRFIHVFVSELKDCESIVMWDLGNECNCLSPAKTPYEAYHWTATVCDAIRCEDQSRPIASGMHALESGNLEGASWLIAHQGELTDCMTPHPYPSPTVGGDVEPYNRLRMTYLPTAQCLFYGGLGKRPAMIQESGTFSQVIGSNKMSGQFMQIQILSALAHNLQGYLWWCAWEQNHIHYSPYSWSMMERELGLFDQNRDPKPVALTMQKMSKMLDAVGGKLPARQTDGVCVLSRGHNKQNVAISACTFAKQAGIELTCAYSDCGDLPDSDLYFLPAITGWQVLYRATWDQLLEKVEAGATMYISYAGGHMTNFPGVVGAESCGISMNTATHTVQTPTAEISYTGREVYLQPTTAQVLWKNETGNPVLLCNQYGKGKVYFLNFAPENLVVGKADAFYTEGYHVVYEQLLPHIKQKPAYCHDANVGVTVHYESEDSAIVCVLNYSDHALPNPMRIDPAWTIESVIYGDGRMLCACDGCILRIRKKA